MKLVLFLSAFVLFSISIQGQSVKAKLGTGGNFLILDSGDPSLPAGDPSKEKVKLLISEEGLVNWYLDGQDMFIRESDFLYDGSNTADYDFLQIDGVNGRVGFNMLSNSTEPTDNTDLTSSVFLNGSIATKVRLLDGSNSYDIRQDDHIMIIAKSSNPDSEMILPPVANSKGREYIFKRNDSKSGKIVVVPTTGESLNGLVDNEIVLGQDNSSLEVVCDGASWWVISEISVTATRLKINSGAATLDSENIIEVNFTAANQTIDLNLPAAANFQDKRYVIKRNANSTLFTGNVLRIIPQSSGSEKLDFYTNANPLEMQSDFEAITVESNGTQWLIVSDYKPELATRTIIASYSPIQNDEVVLADATGGGFVITLPNASAVGEGKEYTLKRVNAGSNFINVQTTSSQTIDGLSVIRLSQVFDYLNVVSDGSNWLIKSERISAVFVNNPTSPYDVTPYDETVTATTSSTFNLPSVNNVLIGKKITFKNTGTGSTAQTIDPDGSETIEGGAAGVSITLSQGDAVTLQSDGTEWIIVSFFSLP